MKLNSQTLKIEHKYFEWDFKIISLIVFFFFISMMPTVAMYYFSYLFIAIYIYILKVNLF